jgi:hypothetical protein
LLLCIKLVNTNITYYFKKGKKSQILFKQWKILLKVKTLLKTIHNNEQLYSSTAIFHLMLRKTWITTYSPAPTKRQPQHLHTISSLTWELLPFPGHHMNILES